MNDKVGRRSFLKTAATAAAAVAIPSGLPSPDHPQPLTGSIPTRVFGKTGLTLPILGYGGAALPRMWGSPLSTEDRVRLVRYVYDQGIRYFDTAGNYMESESILGEGLKGIRDQVCLVTKVEETKPARVRGAVEKSLKALQTDYLDAVLIHGTPGIEQMTVEEAMRIHDELDKLRDEKIITFIGLSAHGYFDKALALISTGAFDQCMISYGYIPRGYDQVHSARMIELRNACLAKAHSLDMGIAAMKVVGAGMLGAWASSIVPGFDERRIQQLPGAAIRWVLDDERIDLLVIGMRLKEEVDANIKIVSRDPTFTPKDRAVLTDYGSKAYESEALKRMRIE